MPPHCNASFVGVWAGPPTDLGAIERHSRTILNGIQRKLSTFLSCESTWFLFLLLWLCQSFQVPQRRMVTGNRGSQDYRKGWKLPRRAGKKKRESFMLVNMKQMSTLKNYRKGLHYLWRHAPIRRNMQRFGIKRVGEWDENNQMAGKLPATASEVASLTDKQVDTLMFQAYETAPTKVQFKKVRAFFSWCYQLQTGQLNQNFPCVAAKRKLHAPIGFSPPLGTGGMATSWLNPTQMRDLICNDWTFDPQWPMPRFSAARLLSYDYEMNAARPECLKRTKKSRTHCINVENRYMWTQMEGGRAKRELRLETMPWKMFRVCTCPGPVHRGLPDDYESQYDLFDDAGFPRQAPTWCSGCPITCWQTIQHFMTRSMQPDSLRVYPRWSLKTNKFSREDIGRDKIHKEIHDFAVYLNACPPGTILSNNGGRKANGQLCDAMRIPFKHSLNWHGDKPIHWRRHYQPGLPQVPTNFRQRKQSTDPLYCIRGHVGILKNWGRAQNMKGFKREPKPEPEPKSEDEGDEKEMGPPPPPPPAPSVVEFGVLKSDITVLKEEMTDMRKMKMQMDQMQGMVAAMYAKL